MKQSKKWAEQCLVENAFSHKNENEATDKTNCLLVCVSGKNLFRKHFIDGKYKDKDMLSLPFDFIVEAGDMCPKGAFYELEYTIGELGMVYRALIQAVNPVTDLPLVIATLKQKNLLPSDMKPIRAWLRDDIHKVCIGICAKDTNRKPVFFSSHNEASDGTMDDGTRISVADYAVKYHTTGCCINYHRGDLREVWIPESVNYSNEKVFVCGVNGDDPDFASQKAIDIDNMYDLLAQATEIAFDYNIPFFYIWNNGKDSFEFESNNISPEEFGEMLTTIKKGDK